MFLLRVPINTLLKQANFVMMLFSPSGALFRVVVRCMLIRTCTLIVLL